MNSRLKEKKFFFKKNLEKNIYRINPEPEDGYSNFLDKLNFTAIALD